MAFIKAQTAFRLHVHVFSIVLLGVPFPFQPLAAPPVPSSSHGHATSPNAVENVLPGDQPRTQHLHRSSNSPDRVAVRGQGSVRQPSRGCLSNSNDGPRSTSNDDLLNITSCVWNVLKKAEREIVRAEDFLQRVLGKVCSAAAECSFLNSRESTNHT